MDDRKFKDGLIWLSEESFCFCANVLCWNTWSRKTSVCTTHSDPVEGELLHTALKSLDCTLVCKLLDSGVGLCCEGEDNCFYNIVKFWTCPVIKFALNLQPSAVNSRGPGGNTLLMLCEDSEKLEALLKFEPEINAINEDGDTVLHHAVKHHLVNSFDRILNIAYALLGSGTAAEIIDLPIMSVRTKLKLPEIQFKRLFLSIVMCGVKMNCLNCEGDSALKIVLSYIKSGYVFTPLHAPFCSKYQDLHHISFLCELSNELVSFALNTLLQLEAKIPPPNERGQTALMLAAQSSWNLNAMKMMLSRGADVRAKDHDGFNAIGYLLRSFNEHCGFDCKSFLVKQSYNVDALAAMFLDKGCSMQGIYLVMPDILEEDDLVNVKTLVHLMALEDSQLNQRQFPQKLQLKNDPSFASFMQLFLFYRQHNPCFTAQLCNFKMSDVAVLEQELSAGLNPNICIPQLHLFSDEEENRWRQQLQITEPLSTLLEFMYSKSGQDHPSRDFYPAVEGVFRLILPFWPNPPLSLLLILFCGLFNVVDDDAVEMEERLIRIINFLYDVGGPLPRGSKLYMATKERLTEMEMEEADKHFDELHAGVASLQQLSRTALRSSFSLQTIDTVGLDLSSLKVKWLQTTLPLPQLIKNYINYRPLTYRPGHL